MSNDSKAITACKSSIEIEYKEHNERARWYASRMWQVPFPFVGIVSISFAQIARFATEYLNIFLAGFGIVGCFVLVHILAVRKSQLGVLDNINSCEEKLGLPQTTVTNPSIYMPLFWLVMLITVSSFANAALLYYSIALSDLREHFGCGNTMPIPSQ